MRTFFATLRSDQRFRLCRPHVITARGRRAAVCIRDRLAERVTPGAQEGFLLVEVIVSALLVALIVVATFNGFDVVNRAQAENRAHDQAVILAAQSQEQMRTDPVSTLETIELTPHKYTQTINGTTYEITQEAAPSNGSANTTGCSAIETSRQNAANVQITSKVTWPRLGIAKRPEVSLSSIITPPTGSGLEVDVGNDPAPTEGVAGVTVIVTFTPTGTAATQTRQGITSTAGCVVFGDIESTSATVEIQEKSGFVTPSGALKVQPKEVTLAPNITVHDPVTYDQGGAIKANFTWEGAPVSADTFVALNASMVTLPQFQLGSNLFSYEGTGEEHYAAETGKYVTSPVTAKGTRYSTGDLFPFLEPNQWVVYAGDCLENSPHKVNAAITNQKVLVKPGATSEVTVPISRTNLLVREGTQKSPGSTTSLPVKITNTACSASLVPNNASKLNLAHEQSTTSAGLLEFPYQPFGAYELCVANKTAKKRYKFTGSNTEAKGTSPAVYLGAKSASEKATLKAAKEKEEKEAKEKREKEEKEAREKAETKEKETKTKREAEEKPAKEKWENEEKTEKKTKETEEATKATRVAKEATEKQQWTWENECRISKNKKSASCEKSGKKEITEAEKTTKEATQKTARIKAEAEETTADTKRKAEEATTKTAREAQEATQKSKEKSEKETKEKRETEETTARTKKEGEEKAVETKRKTEETEETEEATNTKVTVESGFEKC